jgi:hypothetical protein
MILVAKTDRGYIKGDLHSGVEFVDKENARQFTLEEASCYRDSIVADMFDFFDCKEFCFETP